jgi:hypothetical protein
MRFYKDHYTWSIHWGKTGDYGHSKKLGPFVFDISPKGWWIGVEFVR